MLTADWVTLRIPKTDSVREVLVEVMIQIQPTFTVCLLIAFLRMPKSTVTSKLSDKSFPQQSISLRNYVCDARLEVARVHIGITNGEDIDRLSVKNIDRMPHHLVLICRDTIPCAEAPRLC